MDLYICHIEYFIYINNGININKLLGTIKAFRYTLSLR